MTTYATIRTAQKTRKAQGLDYVTTQVEPTIYRVAATPGATDDFSKGYKVGDMWYKTNATVGWFVCTRATTSAAVWTAASGY